MTDAERKLLDEITALKAENAKLKTGISGKLTCKVAEKGGVSVYGLGRWPVTLYREQWNALFAAKPQIEAFIVAHAADLKAKGDAPKAPEAPAGEAAKA